MADNNDNDDTKPGLLDRTKNRVGKALTKDNAKKLAKASGKGAAKLTFAAAKTSAKYSVLAASTVLSPAIRGTLDDLGLGAVSRVYDSAAPKIGAKIVEGQRKRKREAAKKIAALKKKAEEEKKKAELAEEQGKTAANSATERLNEKAPLTPEQQMLEDASSVAVARDTSTSDALKAAIEAKNGMPVPANSNDTVRPVIPANDGGDVTIPNFIDASQIGRRAPVAPAVSQDNAVAPKAKKPRAPRKNAEPKEKKTTAKPKAKSPDEVAEIRKKNLETIKAVGAKRKAAKAAEDALPATAMTGALSSALASIQSPMGGSGGDMAPVIDQLGGILSTLQKMENSIGVMGDAFKSVVVINTEGNELTKELITKLGSIGPSNQPSSAEDALERAKANRIKGSNGRTHWFKNKEGGGLGILSTIMDIIKNSAIVGALLGLTNVVTGLTGVMSKILGLGVLGKVISKALGVGDIDPSGDADKSKGNKPKTNRSPTKGFGKFGAFGRAAGIASFVMGNQPAVEKLDDDGRKKLAEEIASGKMKAEDDHPKLDSNFFREIFGYVGGALGGFMGSAAGAAGGSLAGPAGTAAGGFLGGVVGGEAGYQGGQQAFDAAFGPDDKIKEVRKFTGPGGYTHNYAPQDNKANKEYYEARKAERLQSSAPVIVDAKTTNVTNVSGGGKGSSGPGQHPSGVATPMLNMMEMKLMGIGVPLIP